MALSIPPAAAQSSNPPPLAIQGQAGLAGVGGLVWTGTWSPLINYTYGMAVEWTGSSYVAVVPNVNSAPTPTNANWVLLAQSGNTILTSVITSNGLLFSGGVLSMAVGTNSVPGAIQVTPGNGLSLSSGVIAMAQATNASLGTVQISQANGLAISLGVVSYSPSGVDFSAGNVTATGTTSPRTHAARAADTYNVKDFGAIGDNSHDDTVAIQAAVTAAMADHNRTVIVPCGEYKITGTIVVGQGVAIIGSGSQGSTEQFGTTFTHYFNGSLFRWDGTGAAFSGTGGGLRNCLINKASTFNGGNAIELIATSDNQRPGEMVFHNVLILGTGSGTWVHGLYVDGTAANTPGSRGVRTLYLTKFRVSGVSTGGQSVLLKQVTHFYAHGLATDQGNGAQPGIYLQGINDGLYFTGLGNEGLFTVVANDVNNATNKLFVSGKVDGSFSNADTQVNGVVTISHAGLSNKSKLLKIVADNSPEFYIRRKTAATTVTGDGTTYQVAFDDVIFDTLGNTGGNVFTCTVAGKYIFSCGIALANVGAAHTRSDLAIVQTGSAVRDVLYTANPFAQQAGGNITCNVQGVVLDLAYGDTVFVDLSVQGGAKTVDVFGTNGSDTTWFTGKYMS